MMNCKSNFSKRTLRIPAEFSRYQTVLVILAFLLIAWGVVAPAFFRPNNIGNLFISGSVSILVTVGMCFVLIMGSIDLSVSSVVLFGGDLAVFLINWGMPVWPAVLLAVFACACVGFLNGLFITLTKAPAFIITLAMNTIMTGLQYILCASGSVQVRDKGFAFFGKGSIGPFSVPILISLLVAFIMGQVLRKTRYGEKVYACGANAVAAQYTGIDTTKVRIISHVTVSALSGLAGVIFLSRIMMSQAGSAITYETDAIAACVIGGVAFSGGDGTVLGAVFGAIVMCVITNGLNVWGLNTYWQWVAKGIVLLIAVFISEFSARRAKRE